MRILIIGAGQVGTFLARELSEQHEIVIVEKSKDLVNKIKDSMDVLTVIGDGDDPFVLNQAEVNKADVLLAVSGDDRTNIMSSLIGHSYGVEKIIIRVRNPHYLGYPETLDDPAISIINPGNIISDKILSLITSPFALRTESFADGRIQLFKLRIEKDTPIVNKKLSELGPAQAWIFVGISRDGKMRMPKGETVFNAGDYVFALGMPQVLKKLKEQFALEIDKVHSTIIVGGGELGKTVAGKLDEKGISVKVIENDPEKARETAEELPGVTVFNGDATNSDTMLEAGVDSADYLFALTGSDEENVLSALLAKNLGVKRSSVLYTNPDYIDVLEAIGVDRPISVRMAISNEILSLLHIGGVEHITLLEEGRGEVLEYEVHNDTEILGIPLIDIDFPVDSIIGICLRGEEVIIPKGDFVSQPGDRLIVFALPNAVKRLEQIFC